MAKQTWTITDATDDNMRGETFTIGPKEVPGTPDGWSVNRRTLHGGKQEGVELITIDNGTMRVAVIPTRGMGVWKAWSGDKTLGWQSPIQGPVHPHYVPLMEPSGLGWLDGFDELLVRCGLVSNGAPDFDENHNLTYPLHGRIANLPAHKVDVSVDPETGEIAVTGVVEETRFHFYRLQLTSTITTKFGESSFRIHDEVENLRGTESEMQLLYHTNFGAPLLDGGAKLVAPVKVIVPRNDHAASGIANWDSYPAEQPGSEEQVYFFELLGDEQGNTQTLLKNAHGTQGVSMHFNKQQLPCYSQWKNTPALADGYVTGLEPATNFPNPRSYETEQKRVVRLAPGGKTQFDLRIDWHLDAATVQKSESSIAAIQGSIKPQLFDRPQKRWCAD